MTNTISAAANPALANDLIEKTMAEKPVQKEVTITPPSDTVVTLPGGFISPTGEVITEAEVRELTGKDEEAISKSTSVGKALLTILQRGVVRIGNAQVTDTVLDQMLSGDRDMLLLAIFKATFGDTAHLAGYCNACVEGKEVEVDLNTDIKIKPLIDPINDRVFTVKGKTQEFTVQLPTGVTQKELITNSDKTVAELNTILLENTVIKIGETPVVSKTQVQNLGLVDRRKIVDEINRRVSGPIFEDLSIACPNCEGEVQVPISLGVLFRF